MVCEVCEDVYTSTVEWVFAKCSSESNRSTNGDEIIVKDFLSLTVVL